MKVQSIIISLATILLLGGCKSSALKTDELSSASKTPDMTILGSEPREMLPRAVVYKTNGDYNQYVTISVNKDGRILSFPDPRDVSTSSEPISLGDGWLLDRRGGIGPNTRFIRYTYEEYHNLASPPSIFELKEAIIKDAAVTQTIVLHDFTPNQAIQELGKVKQLIKKYE